MDSGSDSILLSSKTISEIDTKWKSKIIDNGITGIGVGGKSFKIYQMPVKMSVGQQSMNILVSIYISDSQDTLLGLDFIKMFKINLLTNDNSLQIVANGEIIPSLGNTSFVYGTNGKKITKVKRKSIKHVECNVYQNLKGDYLVEPLTYVQHVVPQIVHFDNNNSFKAIFYNNGRKTITFKRQSLQFVIKPLSDNIIIQDLHKVAEQPDVLYAYLKCGTINHFGRETAWSGKGSAIYNECKEIIDESKIESHLNELPGIEIHGEFYKFEDQLQELSKTNLKSVELFFIPILKMIRCYVFLIFIPFL